MTHATQPLTRSPRTRTTEKSPDATPHASQRFTLSTGEPGVTHPSQLLRAQAARRDTSPRKWPYFYAHFFSFSEKSEDFLGETQSGRDKRTELLWLLCVFLSRGTGRLPASRPVLSYRLGSLWVSRRGTCWPRTQDASSGPSQRPPTASMCRQFGHQNTSARARKGCRPQHGGPPGAEIGRGAAR